MSTRPLVILSSSRSGSNYALALVRALAPATLILREIFRRKGDNLPELSALIGRSQDDILAEIQDAPDELWTRLTQASESAGRNLACKIFYYHQKVDGPLWDRVARDATIVHLIRRRLLDAYVSLQVAQRTGAWIRMGAENPFRTVEPFAVDLADLMAFIELRQSHIARFRTRLADAATEIYYEDIAAAPSDGARAFAPILNCPIPQTLEIETRRQNVHALPDLISNYDEIAHLDRDLVELTP